MNRREARDLAPGMPVALARCMTKVYVVDEDPSVLRSLRRLLSAVLFS